MIAIDNGIWNGNFNAADIFFLIGVIVAVLAALLAVPRDPPRSSISPVLGWLAVGCVALGLALI